MGKRKRDNEDSSFLSQPEIDKSTVTNGSAKPISETIQIITGSYERVLHGFQATVGASDDQPKSVQFLDTFLYNAHASAIRCLALSPVPNEDTLAENARIMLASGGTDERINLYSLSVFPLTENKRLPSIPVLGGNKVQENPDNRELGSLLQHSSSITSLSFPTRSKLLAAAEDNTISISRVRDLEVVSTIRPPRPKVQSRPSGDTAPPGATPVGVNDFAVHPSMKLMLSVSKGEKCMRLWNLVTGKKAGALNFSRESLESVKEGKHSSGEGRRIEWDTKGEQFVIAFERGAIVYGIDSVPTCKILPMPLTKLHQMRYLGASKGSSILAVSTEDGRILFYASKPVEDQQLSVEETTNGGPKTVPDAQLLAQLGGKSRWPFGRIKDFKMLHPAASDEPWTVVTAGSDGVVRIWTIAQTDLNADVTVKDKKQALPRQVGDLIGTHETGNRITCLEAYSMFVPPAEEMLGENDGITEGEEDSDSDH